MGISKPVFYQFVKDTGMEMIGRGIYATDEAWIDDAYILSLRCPEIIFSHEEALFLHGLTDREEVKYLDTFLYEAIFIPEGVEAPPMEIINQPELQVYVDGFGTRNGDVCFVAETDGVIVGAVWVRIMDDYGHIDDKTPSFAISLLKEYRGKGIGTELMKRMLEELKSCGYKQASLAVQKKNYAVKMYLNVGFEIVDENQEEYIMVCKIR